MTAVVNAITTTSLALPDAARSSAGDPLQLGDLVSCMKRLERSAEILPPGWPLDCYRDVTPASDLGHLMILAFRAVMLRDLHLTLWSSAADTLRIWLTAQPQLPLSIAARASSELYGKAMPSALSRTSAQTFEIIESAVIAGSTLSRRQWLNAMSRSNRRFNPSMVLVADTGREFRTWRRIARVRRATIRLTTSNEHVRQIAIELGYRQPAHLDHHFNTVCGTAPKTFRSLAAFYTDLGSGICRKEA